MRQWVTPSILMDPDVVTCVAGVAVRGALVRTGHLRLPAGLPAGGLYPHDVECLPPNALLGLRYGLVHHRLPANRPVQAEIVRCSRQSNNRLIESLNIYTQRHP